MYGAAKLGERQPILLGDGQFRQELSRVHVYDHGTDDLAGALTGKYLGEPFGLAVADGSVVLAERTRVEVIGDAAALGLRLR
jgi:hypothetical protein